MNEDREQTGIGFWGLDTFDAATAPPVSKPGMRDYFATLRVQTTTRVNYGTITNLFFMTTCHSLSLR